MYFFPNFELVHCSMSGSDCCFLTCIQISQEVGKMVCYFHLFKNFPHRILLEFSTLLWATQSKVLAQSIMPMFLWNFHAFSMIQWMLAIWYLVPLSFLNPAWTPGSSQFTYCWSLTWRILSIILLACEMSARVWDDPYARGRDRVSLRGEGQSCQPIPTWNKQTLSTSGPRRKEKWPHKRQSQTCLECLALCDMAHRFTE